MAWSLLVGGSVLLVLLAVLVGLSQATEQESQRSAWRRIARARREINEERQRLELTSECVEWCENCPFRREA